jgi:hypothetical protein
LHSDCAAQGSVTLGGTTKDNGSPSSPSAVSPPCVGPRNRSPMAFRLRKVRLQLRWCSPRSWMRWQRWHRRPSVSASRPGQGSPWKNTCVVRIPAARGPSPLTRRAAESGDRGIGRTGCRYRAGAPLGAGTERGVTLKRVTMAWPRPKPPSRFISPPSPTISSALRPSCVPPGPEPTRCPITPATPLPMRPEYDASLLKSLINRANFLPAHRSH